MMDSNKNHIPVKHGDQNSNRNSPRSPSSPAKDSRNGIHHNKIPLKPVIFTNLPVKVKKVWGKKGGGNFSKVVSVNIEGSQKSNLSSLTSQTTFHQFQLN